jgi:hypothetical protein
MKLAAKRHHHGIVIVIGRRNTSGRAGSTLSAVGVRGETELQNNIDFA